MKVFTTIVMFVVIAAITVTLSANDKVRELKLQQAIDLIESKGDLAKATPLLEEVAKSTDRALAARGLLHLAQAQERFGRGDPLATYQRIVTEFGGTTEAAAIGAVVIEARARLTALDQNDTGLMVRQVPGAPADGRVFQDGRYSVFTDGGNVVLYDFESGRKRPLTNARAERGAYALSPVPSPDGRLIAYHWVSAGSQAHELNEVRLVSRDGGQPRVVHPKGTAYTATFGWSPDSKAILMGAEPKGIRELVLTPIDGGALRSLKRLENRQEWNFRLSPDGRYVAYDLQTAPDKSEHDVRILAIDSGREVLLSNPANEEMLAWFPEGDRILFASDRGGSWGIWAQQVIDGRAHSEPVLVRSNTGNVWPQGFTKKGAFHYGILNEQLEVYVAALDPATSQAGTLTRLPGRFLGNKSAAVWSPAGDRLAYVQSATNTLVVQITDTGAERPIKLPLQAIGSPSWSPDGKSVIVDGQSLDLRRGLYQVDIASGALNTIVEQDPARREPRRDQPALAPGGRLYFSRTPQTSNVAMDIAVRDGSSADQLVIADTIRSFALSPDGHWLAVARPGRVPHPRLLLYSTSGGAPRSLGTSSEDWAPMAPAWSRDNRFVFVSRSTQGTQEIWRFPLDGGDPVNVGVRWHGAINRIDVHPDGRHLAISTRATSSETWVLQNIPPQK